MRCPARLRCRPTAVLASSCALPPSSGQTISEEGGVEDEAGVAAHVMHKNLAALKARASLRQRWAFSAHAQRSGVGRIDSLAKRPDTQMRRVEVNESLCARPSAKQDLPCDFFCSSCHAPPTRAGDRSIQKV